MLLFPRRALTPRLSGEFVEICMSKFLCPSKSSTTKSVDVRWRNRSLAPYRTRHFRKPPSAVLFAARSIFGLILGAGARDVEAYAVFAAGCYLRQRSLRYRAKLEISGERRRRVPPDRFSDPKWRERRARPPDRVSDRESIAIPILLKLRSSNTVDFLHLHDLRIRIRDRILDSVTID
jgi:hypothetical protein